MIYQILDCSYIRIRPWIRTVDVAVYLPFFCRWRVVLAHRVFELLFWVFLLCCFRTL